MQSNQWVIIGDQLPMKSPIELKDNSIAKPEVMMLQTKQMFHDIKVRRQSSMNYQNMQGLQQSNMYKCKGTAEKGNEDWTKT